MWQHYFYEVWLWLVEVTLKGHANEIDFYFFFINRFSKVYHRCPARALKRGSLSSTLPLGWCYRLPDKELATRSLPSNFYDTQRKSYTICVQLRLSWDRDLSCQAAATIIPYTWSVWYRVAFPSESGQIGKSVRMECGRTRAFIFAARYCQQVCCASSAGSAYGQNLHGFVTITNHIIYTINGAHSNTGAYYG
jgi:hypothetical protein